MSIYQTTLLYERMATMTRKYLVLSLYMMLSVYAVTTALLGERGLVEIDRLRTLLEERKSLESSLVDQLVIKEDDASRLETDFSRIMEEAYALGYVQEDELRLVLDEPAKGVKDPDDSEIEDLFSAESTDQRVRILGLTSIPTLSHVQILFISLLATICFDTILLIIVSLRRNRQKSMDRSIVKRKK